MRIHTANKQLVNPLSALLEPFSEVYVKSLTDLKASPLMHFFDWIYFSRPKLTQIVFRRGINTFKSTF